MTLLHISLMWLIANELFVIAFIETRGISWGNTYE